MAIETWEASQTVPTIGVSLDYPHREITLGKKFYDELYSWDGKQKFLMLSMARKLRRDVLHGKKVVKFKTFVTGEGYVEYGQLAEFESNGNIARVGLLLQQSTNTCVLLYFVLNTQACFAQYRGVKGNTRTNDTKPVDFFHVGRGLTAELISKVFTKCNLYPLAHEITAYIKEEANVKKNEAGTTDGR